MKDPCLLCLSSLSSGWKERQLFSLLTLIQCQNYSNQNPNSVDLNNQSQSKFVSCSQCEFFISSAFKIYTKICQLNTSLQKEIENIRVQILQSQAKEDKFLPKNVRIMRKSILELSGTNSDQISNFNEPSNISMISAEEIHVKIEKFDEDSQLQLSETMQHQAIAENEPTCILPISEEEIKIKLEKFEEDSNPGFDFEDGPSNFIQHSDQEEEMEMEFEDAEPFNCNQEDADYFSYEREASKAKKRKATSSEEISEKKSKSKFCEESKEEEADAFWAKYPKPMKMKWGYLYPCPICPNTRFTSKSKLINHMFKKHETEDKPLSCNKCEKKFTQELNLERHVHLHQFEESYPLICDVCDTRFADVDRFNTHSETHTQKKGEFPCEYCGKIFYASHHLRVHLRIHTGERPLKCKFCPESFIDASRRKVHYEKVHNNNQKFPCHLCEAVLATSAGLKKHLNSHEGKGCFSGSICEVEGCGQVFKHGKTLLSHQIKVHGKEGFVCDECGTTLATKYGLKEHKRSHLGLKQFKCDICPAEFMRKTSLKAHLAKHEEEQEQKGI